MLGISVSALSRRETGRTKITREMELALRYLTREGK